MTVAPGSMRPLLGLTQYRRGAVVLTLKHTLLSDGFLSFRLVVTTSVKGPTHTHTHTADVHQETSHNQIRGILGMSVYDFSL